MRHPRELAFRARQEFANLWFALAKPGPPGASSNRAPLPGLPAPESAAGALRGTSYAHEVECLANTVLQHRFPLLGLEIATGADIAWRRDYVHGKELGTAYYRATPYLDFARAGDHKIIWELNRHQHLVLLAQAHLLTGRQEYVREIAAELETWRRANPFMRGMNWTSALEVAFRAFSWIWVWHLAAPFLTEPDRRNLLADIYRHGLYLEYNLSFYFSPNTHLLGEAVVLHALGALFDGLPRAQRWAELGGRITREQMEAQIREDGSHFEQSTYYHVYALDMFLFHAVIAGMPEAYRRKLVLMAEYLDRLLGQGGALPFLGDDDGGRLFHPYGPRNAFGRATLASCAAVLGRSEWACPAAACEQAAWWLGPQALAAPAATAAAKTRGSRLFAGAGLAFLSAGAFEGIADAGPFGEGSGGHSHSDTLSVVVRNGAEEILADAGTFTYISDPEWRNWFRGSAAHNTVRIAGRDQATPAGPFRWAGKPEVNILEWTAGNGRVLLDAECRYGGFRHRRQILLEDADGAPLLWILDTVEGPPGDTLVEQFWHPGEPALALGERCFQIGAACRLLLTAPAVLETGGENGWRSTMLAAKSPAPVIIARVPRAALPVQLGAVIDASGRAESIALAHEAGAVVLRLAGVRTGEARFRE